MAKNYDGWAIKYGWGCLDASTFKTRRADVIREWDEADFGDGSLTWKNISRRCGHKIVKVKLVEVSDEKTE